MMKSVFLQHVHCLLANIRFHCRLQKLLGDVVISQGGVVPFINPEVSQLTHLIVSAS